MDTKELKPRVKKGLWKPEEDLILKKYVETYGEGNWATISKIAGLNRGGKSCRLRWKNYLRPNIKRGAMSEQEEDLIIRMHKLLGNRWSLIAGRLPGRTDNDVKNYWNTHLSKKCHQGKIKSMELNGHCNANEDNDKNKKVHPLCDTQLVPIASVVNMTVEGNKAEITGGNIVRNPENSEGKILSFDTGSQVALANSEVMCFQDDDFMPFWDSYIFFETLEFTEIHSHADVQSLWTEFANPTI